MTKFKFLLSSERPNEVGAIGRFDALVSKADVDGKIVTEFPAYIKIVKDRETAFFKTVLPGKYKGYIYVDKDRLATISNDSPIEYSTISERRFLCYRFWNDKSLRFTRTGLLLAVAGTIIDGSFAIGKFTVLIPVTDWQAGYLLGISTLLKIVGLILVFWNTIKNTK